MSQLHILFTIICGYCKQLIQYIDNYTTRGILNIGLII